MYKSSLYKYDFEPISENLTNFEKYLSKLELIRYIENQEKFHKETAYNKKVDGKLSYYYQFSQIQSNKFNPGSGYLTHGFDFYRGSFHGQMIRGLINYCNLKDNALILDPFCGCGTTLIESKLLGFKSIGIDINPIACLNSKVKTELLNISLELMKSIDINDFDLLYYKNKDFSKILQQNIKDLFYLFLYTRALASSSRFSFNINTGFNRTYQKIVKTLKSFELLKNKLEINFGKSEIIFNDSLIELKKIKPNSVDAIITSPPYLDLIDYIQEDLIPIKNLFDNNQIKSLKNRSIGNRYGNQSINDKLYWNKINKILDELYRVLKNDGNCIIIIGDYRYLKDKFIRLVLEKKFYLERILRRKIVNIKKKDNIEYVLFLKKNHHFYSFDCINKNKK